MTLFARCWFCLRPEVTRYYIPVHSHSIERVCNDCPASDSKLNTYKTLNDAQTGLVRIKLFGEKP